jgi:hypothetical protein
MGNEIKILCIDCKDIGISNKVLRLEFEKHCSTSSKLILSSNPSITHNIGKIDH